MGLVHLLGFTDKADIIGDNPQTAVIDPAQCLTVCMKQSHLNLWKIFKV